MKELIPGNVVISTAGHDKDEIYLIINIDGKFAVLADGKKRKLDNPKTKNLRHVKYLAEGGVGLKNEEIAHLIKEIVKGR